MNLYTNGTKKFLDNLRQFEKLSIDPNKELNFTLNCEQKVTDILKEKIKIRLMKTHTIPTYMIAKFLVPMLEDLTSNYYSVRDPFDFFKEILQQNFDCFMESLDINSLFTNIPMTKP